MELNIFMHELKKALVERGIPEETAAKHVSNLSRSFTNDDLSEINAIRSYEEVQQLADSISVILSKGRSSQQQNPPPAPEQIPPVATPSDRLEAKEVVVKPQARQAPRQRPQPKAEEDSYFEYSPENTPSTKGMLIFWVGLFSERSRRYLSDLRDLSLPELSLLLLLLRQAQVFRSSALFSA